MTDHDLKSSLQTYISHVMNFHSAQAGYDSIECFAGQARLTWALQESGFRATAVDIGHWEKWASERRQRAITRWTFWVQEGSRSLAGMHGGVLIRYPVLCNIEFYYIYYIYNILYISYNIMYHASFLCIAHGHIL